MPHEGIGKYFLAVVPPPPVYEEALAFKNYFKDHYASKAALRSPPHITLHMPFEWKLRKETQLIDGIDRFAQQHRPVSVQLDGFGSFAPRVIFINVLSNNELIALQKSLMRFCKMEFNLFNAEYKDLPFHPHLTVAFRDLRKPAFFNAWAEFATRSYRASFVAVEIVLLKHDGTKWLPHHKSAFSELLVP